MTEPSSRREKSVGDVVNALRKSHGHYPATLLIGAGCSISGGIPSAPRIVQQNKDAFESEYAAAVTAYKNDHPSDSTLQGLYPYFMYQLVPADRDAIIIRLLEHEKLNWAHLGIAQLLTTDYFGYILTVNFDRLLPKSMAFVGEFPAIYDRTTIPMVRGRNVIPNKAVFYLHGQGGVTPLIHRIEDSAEHLQKLRDFLANALQRGPVIISGYSGVSDPVFDVLTEQESFQRGLYWSAYGSELPKHVQELMKKDGAYYLLGQDADRFFIELCQSLGCFPPKPIHRPLEYLKTVFSGIASFPAASDSERASTHNDPMQAAHDVVNKARGFIAEDAWSETSLNLMSLEMQGEYEEAAKLAQVEWEQADSQLKPEIADRLAWIYIAWADHLTEGPVAQWGDRFDRAAEIYQRALDANPDRHEALLNWGWILGQLADTASEPERTTLYRQAIKKYEQALQTKPDDHEALYNWGVSLGRLADTTYEPERSELHHEAIQKYERALQSELEFSEALNGWGVALERLADTASEPERTTLYRQAIEKYERALQTEPEHPEALYNWGVALERLADTASEPERTTLYRQAIEKYERALQSNPDKHEALYSWGIALGRLANTAPEPERSTLRRQEIEKYERALQSNPDNHEALYNWGIALGQLADTASEPERSELRHQAIEKYERILAITPKDAGGFVDVSAAYVKIALDQKGSEAPILLKKAKEMALRAVSLSPREIYQLACVQSLLGEFEECRASLLVALEAGTLPEIEHLKSDTDLDPIRDEPWFADLVRRRAAQESST